MDIIDVRRKFLDDNLSQIQEIAFELQRGEQLSDNDLKLVKKILFIIIGEIHWRRGQDADKT